SLLTSKRWSACSFRQEFVDRLRVGFSFFQHWQMSRILHPLDANNTGNVVGESLGNRGTEIRVVLAPQDQGRMAEAPDSIESSHILEIVFAIELPIQKTPQAQPSFRSRHVRAGEGSQNLIA